MRRRGFQRLSEGGDCRSGGVTVRSVRPASRGLAGGCCIPRTGRGSTVAQGLLSPTCLDAFADDGSLEKDKGAVRGARCFIFSKSVQCVEGGEEPVADEDDVVAHGLAGFAFCFFFEGLIDAGVGDGGGGCGEFVGS